jgi:hypothetical protein
VSGWSYLSDSAAEQNKKHLKNGKRKVTFVLAPYKFKSGPGLIGGGSIADDRLGVIGFGPFCPTSISISVSSVLRG